MAGYYQQNNEILKFNIDSDLEEIKFNHYISQKENLQRMKGGLPRGQLYLTLRNIATDLNISFSKAQRLVMKFEKLGIIELIEKFQNWEKRPSIYKMTAVSDTQTDTQSDTQKVSDTNGYKGMTDTQSDTQSDTSKKESFKNNYIYSQVIDHLNNKTGSKYKSNTTATKKLINARIKDGFTIDDIIQVIDIKVATWKNTDYEKYLRPETLFGSKFESYLNEKKNQPANSWGNMKQF